MIKKQEPHDISDEYFLYFVIITSSAVSFAHGGNDVANVIGPFGSIYISA